MLREIVVRLGAAALMAATLAGCGEASDPVGQSPYEGMPKEVLKQRLEYIAQSGTTGSGLAGMRDAISNMNDPALMKEYEQLEKAAPAKAKQIAKSMASKL
jgi:hypothetical protein